MYNSANSVMIAVPPGKQFNKMDTLDCSTLVYVHTHIRTCMGMWFCFQS